VLHVRVKPLGEACAFQKGDLNCFHDQALFGSRNTELHTGAWSLPNYEAVIRRVRRLFGEQ
jgi:hypothetical protein